MRMKTMTLTTVDATIKNLHAHMSAADEIGLETVAQALCDEAWDLMIIRQGMRKARAIDLRTRLGK